MTVSHYFPVDAEYVFKLRFGGVAAGTDEALVDPYQIRIPVKAGLQTIGVTTPRQNPKAESEAPGGGRGGGGGGRGGAAGTQPPTPVDLRLNGARLKRFDVVGGGDINKLLITGPFKPTGRGDTPSRRKIFVCRPANSAEEPACARTILTTLAHRAFRRPVTSADVTPLLAFYQKGRTSGDFDNGIQSAIQAMLVSPDFLFRFERDPKPAQGVQPQAHRISDVELASRLSFFLWSTIPDDELLSAGREEHAVAAGGSGASGASDARRPARRHTGLELRRPVAEPEKRRDAEAGSGHFPVRRGAAAGVHDGDGAVCLQHFPRGSHVCSSCCRPTTPSSTRDSPSIMGFRASTAHSSAE